MCFLQIPVVQCRMNNLILKHVTDLTKYANYGSSVVGENKHDAIAIKQESPVRVQNNTEINKFNLGDDTAPIQAPYNSLLIEDETNFEVSSNANSTTGIKKKSFNTKRKRIGGVNLYPIKK